MSLCVEEKCELEVDGIEKELKFSKFCLIFHISTVSHSWVFDYVRSFIQKVVNYCHYGSIQITSRNTQRSLDIWKFNKLIDSFPVWKLTELLQSILS